MIELLVQASGAADEVRAPELTGNAVATYDLAMQIGSPSGVRDSRVALITGASGGIGAAIARILAGQGYQLLLTARNEDQLRALADELSIVSGRPAVVYRSDLAIPGAAAELFANVESAGHEVSILVNNAGMGDFGPFVESDPQRLIDMVRLNVESVAVLTRAISARMVARGAGRILNLASVASFQPGPFMAAYYATKAFVLSLSEGLAEELAGSGVTVTAICPGPVGTDFHRRAGITKSGAMRPESMPDPEAVARFACAAMFRGRRVAVHGLLFRVLILVGRFLPRRSVARFVRRMQERRR